MRIHYEVAEINDRCDLLTGEWFPDCFCIAGQSNKKGKKLGMAVTFNKYPTKRQIEKAKLKIRKTLIAEARRVMD